jgi:hypothetical protein
MMSVTTRENCQTGDIRWQPCARVSAKRLAKRKLGVGESFERDAAEHAATARATE